MRPTSAAVFLLSSAALVAARHAGHHELVARQPPRADAPPALPIEGTFACSPTSDLDKTKSNADQGVCVYTSFGKCEYSNINGTLASGADGCPAAMVSATPTGSTGTGTPTKLAVTPTSTVGNGASRTQVFGALGMVFGLMVYGVL